MSDSFFMQRALELADEPVRSPSPNPRVGAVLVRDGEIVAEGYHSGPGHEHAEETAIRTAGDAATGSTLYCTLEPCSHCGAGKRRPPCAPLVVGSGVRRAVIAQLDPNPMVRGNGIAILEAAGIDVSVGTLAAEAVELNAGFNTWMALARPFVHIKTAQSLDGRIAAADGSSRWITDEEARRRVHRERGRHDAVVVGIGTVIADDPLLSMRDGTGRRPAAVVLDRRARTPISSRLVRERAGETIVVTGPAAPESAIAALRAAGVRVLEASGDGAASQLRALGGIGILSLYVEGGRTLTTALLESGLFDQITTYHAPVLIGGDAVALEPPAAATMDRSIRLEAARAEVVGPQAVISGFRPGWRESICDAMGRDDVPAMREVARVHGSR